MRLSNTSCYICLGVLLLGMSPAQANDSTAALGAGGLVFTHSEHIRMDSEDLYISKEKIRVSYLFRNTSGQDIKTRVAFPLPEAWLDADGSPFDYGEDDLPKDKNLMRFSVVVNGKPQPFQTEDKQRTEEGAKIHRITHHWMQNFPAGKTLSIVHEYKPAVGGAVAFGMQGEQDGRYCIDRDLQQWIDSQRKAHFEIPTAIVEYILTTGANWQGPIGKFRLTLKKSSPEEKISFCGNGVNKMNDTTFVMEKTDFIPKRDLSILYLQKPYRLQ